MGRLKNPRDSRATVDAPVPGGRERLPSGRMWLYSAIYHAVEPMLSDVVHGGAGGAVLALDDVGDRRRREDLAGGARGVGEDAGGLAAEWAVEELDDLQDGDLGGLAREGVAALDAALLAQDAGAAQDG